MMVRESHIRLAAGMYKARAAARTILGATYHQQIAEYETALTTLASLTGRSVTKEAVLRAVEYHTRWHEPHGALFILAAAVELTERAADREVPRRAGANNATDPRWNCAERNYCRECCRRYHETGDCDRGEWGHVPSVEDED